MYAAQQPKRPMTHIVIVDDEPIVRALIRGHLADEFSQISEARSADELERLLVTSPVDLVLLDIMLPDKDGLAVTRDLRSRSNIGIILVSKRGDDLDRILGLEMGADDYITKPFVPRELVARAKTVLRRVRLRDEGSDLSATIRFDNWLLDLNTRVLTDPDNNAIRLTTGEFIILSHFVQKPGVIFARSRLAAFIGLDGEPGSERSVDVLISRLRRKLQDNPRDPRYIVTVHKEGYIFASQTY